MAKWSDSSWSRLPEPKLLEGDQFTQPLPYDTEGWGLQEDLRLARIEAFGSRLLVTRASQTVTLRAQEASGRPRRACRTA